MSADTPLPRITAKHIWTVSDYITETELLRVERDALAEVLTVLEAIGLGGTHRVVRADELRGWRDRVEAMDAMWRGEIPALPMLAADIDRWLSGDTLEGT